MIAMEQGARLALIALFKHNLWANLRLIEFCRGLSAEQLDSTMPGVFGSIRDMLRHTAFSEYRYAGRFNGNTMAEPPPRDEWVDFDTLARAVEWAANEYIWWASSDQPDEVYRQRISPEKVELYPLSALAVQVINHASEHRTQIAAILSQLGLEPPDMAGWEYMIATGLWQEVEEPE